MSREPCCAEHAQWPQLADCVVFQKGGILPKGCWKHREHWAPPAGLCRHRRSVTYALQWTQQVLPQPDPHIYISTLPHFPSQTELITYSAALPWGFLLLHEKFPDKVQISQQSVLIATEARSHAFLCPLQLPLSCRNKFALICLLVNVLFSPSSSKHRHYLEAEDIVLLKRCFVLVSRFAVLSRHHIVFFLGGGVISTYRTLPHKILTLWLHKFYKALALVIHKYSNWLTHCILCDNLYWV